MLVGFLRVHFPDIFLHVRSHGGDVRRKWLVNGVHQENYRYGEAIYSGEALQL